MELLAPFNESLLESYVNNEIIPDALLRKTRTANTASECVSNLFGSAMTGMGVTELLEKLPALIPALTSAQEEPLSGVVFKIEREPSGEKVAYIRVFR